MAKPVLQTRNVGMKPHYSGHPLAPMEIVYQCEEPVRRRPSLALRVWTVACLCVCAYVFIGAIVQALT